MLRLPDLDHAKSAVLSSLSSPSCGGELERIQFLLGHASVLTTERYLGCKQKLEEPVKHRFGALFAMNQVEVN